MCRALISAYSTLHSCMMWRGGLPTGCRVHDGDIVSPGRLPEEDHVTSDRLKVLYIAGAHRSGTTLLSDILGSYDGVTGTGELHELWAGLLSGRPCGCG